MIGTGLTWGPVYEPLEKHMRSGDALLLAISPFIGLDALKRFLESAESHTKIQIVVRWRPEDLWTGVGDLDVYPYLAERGIPLYINHDIHLKLYVFESNVAFATSGNLTLRGFGYGEKGNIEVGSFIRLNQADWVRIYALINGSRQVNEELYRIYRKYVEGRPKISIPALLAPSLPSVSKVYKISSLPATETPVGLIKYYFTPDSNEHSPEDTRRAAHDLAAFRIPSGLSETELTQCLGSAFRGSPFVIRFVELLQCEKSLRFGAVNDWIHQMCEDVPLPYRWEIKENTRIFYNWLQHFFAEITWDRPSHSQVIYWRGGSAKAL